MAYISTASSKDGSTERQIFLQTTLFIRLFKLLKNQYVSNELYYVNFHVFVASWKLINDSTWSTDVTKINVNSAVKYLGSHAQMAFSLSHMVKVLGFSPVTPCFCEFTGSYGCASLTINLCQNPSDSNQFNQKKRTSSEEWPLKS